MTETRAIKQFIENEFFHHSVGITLDSSLFTEGVLDSMNLVGLIAFLEERFEIEVKPSEISENNFNTIERIASYVARKKNT